jgi:hypothetical protein
MEKTYKDFIGTCVGSRLVKGQTYGFALVKTANGKAITAICDSDKLPARGEEIGYVEVKEKGKVTYRVW